MQRNLGVNPILGRVNNRKGKKGGKKGKKEERIMANHFLVKFPVPMNGIFYLLFAISGVKEHWD